MSATVPAAKPLLSLSLDLDNLWTYMRTHGDPGWEGFPSYLDRLVPIVLDVLARHRFRISVFIVGKDASLPANAGALEALAAAGHEIGNHSFMHEQWLHRYQRAALERDLGTAEEHIERVTGRRPIGFRGPGFSVSADVLDVLAGRGYLYDASTFPTFLGPLARLYYFRESRNLSAEERAQRSQLFGTLADGLRPLAPYRWSTASGPLIEIPVSTMPIARVPFHMSYLLYLLRFSPLVARAYASLALGLCRVGRLAPSFLLHPLDFLGREDIEGLAFFPGMDLPRARKLAFVERTFEAFARTFQVVPMEEHARAVAEEPGLRRLTFEPAAA